MDLKITWRRAERRTGHLELLPADLRRKRFQLTSRELYLILQRTCRCSFSAVSKLTFVSFLSFATLFFSKSTRRLSSPLLFPFLLFPFRPSNLGLFGAPLQTLAPEKKTRVTMPNQAKKCPQASRAEIWHRFFPCGIKRTRKRYCRRARWRKPAQTSARST